jgi:2-iminobutanoate/2-iminopropanoate deaminase
MPRQPVSCTGAPAAIGPYSPAVQAGAFLFISGQVPIDPATGEVVGGGIAAETRRVLENVRALVEAGGLTMADVVRTTVFLTDLNDFAAMNSVYGEFFPAPSPARSTVQVARLPRDVRVEIDAIALATT